MRTPTLRDGNHLADSNPDVYNRYLVRRVLEFKALSNEEARALPRDEYDSLTSEWMLFNLRYNTSDAVGKARFDQIRAEEKAMIGIAS